MKAYLISIGIGLLVGILYSLFNVRSPAPPVIALLGLLCMLTREQAISFGKRRLQNSFAQERVGAAEGAEARKADQ